MSNECLDTTPLLFRGLIFLKYVSDAFEEKHAELVNEGVAHSFLTFGRWVWRQSLKNYGDKRNTVRGPEKSRADSQKLPLCSQRDYVAVSNGRERDSLIVKVINERSTQLRRWLWRVGKKVVFDSKDCENSANKN
jgi:hypothetical protein